MRLISGRPWVNGPVTPGEQQPLRLRRRIALTNESKTQRAKITSFLFQECVSPQ